MVRPSNGGVFSSRTCSSKLNRTYTERVDFIPSALAEAVQGHLADLSIVTGDLRQITWLHAAPMVLAIDDRRINVGILYLPRMSATEALQAAHAVPQDIPLLVVGPRIHESSAKTFRARGIWYLDEAGNAYLRDHGLLVDVRGRRGEASVSQDSILKVGPSNPFSPRRAQVVFVLLSRPDLADAPLREIARYAGVSVGIAKETIDTLVATGFVEQTSAYRHLVRSSELLDLWGSTYPAGLGRSNKIFVGSGDVLDWSVPDGVDFAVSGEQAARNYIRHAETLVLYIRADEKRRTPTDLLLRNRWNRDPSGNVTIRRMFWRNLDGLAENVAPPLLIYADLLAAHEPRQTQVAHELRVDLEQRT